jgi:regulator of protease activity HflC (stomatin/prohibitin superfamily)
MNTILKFLLGLIGFHSIPENYKAVVMRFGRYYRVCEPDFAGLVWVAPLIDKVENHIEIGMRFTTFTVKQVVSSDCIPFEVELTIRYKFDPGSIEKPESIPQLVRLPDHVLETIVKEHAENSLRSTVANCSAKDIYNRSAIAKIERSVFEGLKAQAGHLGLVPIASGKKNGSSKKADALVEHLGLAPIASGKKNSSSEEDDHPGEVVIREITPPDDFLETMLTAKRYERTLEVLTAYQAADVNQALIAMLVSKGAPPTLLSSLIEFLRLSRAGQRDE